MTLRSLLDQVMVKSWDRWTWFEDVQLVGSSLLVPDAGRAKTIERCFLPRLQEFAPDLDVKVVAPVERHRTAHKPSQGLFKKGKEPQPFAQDLLSSTED